ncbi:MAG: hypothetical protein J7L89_01055 [Bacteroidales bacterium]|nr:hypothetical protein [Bacteroidales bacterium]
MISPRENLLHACRREGFEWVPLDFLLCDAQIENFKNRTGHTDYFKWFDMDFRWVTLQEHPGYTHGQELYTREELPRDTEFDLLGVGHSKGSAAAYHMTRMHHPLKGDISPEEILNYPLPHFTEAENQELFKEVQSLNQQGLATMCPMQMTIWESSWYLRSMEDLLTDIMFGDEKATLLLDRVTQYAIDRVRLYTRAGVDILSLGDDLGAQKAPLMSVDMWLNWIQPRLKKVIVAAREINPDILVFYHSCGFVTPFIEHLIETGIDILNPVQPESMDFNEIYSQFGDRLSFWGTLGTQQLLPFGTPAEIREVIEDRLKTCGTRGGLVLGPTHLVEPEVPFENLEVIKEIARSLYPKY